MEIMIRAAILWTRPKQSVLSKQPWILCRAHQNQAYDAAFDVEQLQEARKWHASFSSDCLPQGRTTYARSSGPGGQHVNKYVRKSFVGFDGW